MESAGQGAPGAQAALGRPSPPLWAALGQLSLPLRQRLLSSWPEIRKERLVRQRVLGGGLGHFLVPPLLGSLKRKRALSGEVP